ncbi:inactive phospholipase C-like protein 2 [Paramacrobiotus metropolitanus]|uniref:inactive phospholipase C-like protein 2 n=1 Tax=Paramacrobiotus metropolitanus TaxID=2943436 RepID=UPI002445C695|nr:inactive phospholipase C-like protein 2 [Paramacrobiotus metropolitanus]
MDQASDKLINDGHRVGDFVDDTSANRKPTNVVALQEEINHQTSQKDRRDNHFPPERSESRESGITRRSSIMKDNRPRNRVKKTVSFTSMPSEKKITSVADCLAFMTRGTKLIKVRSNSRQYWRTFTLDTDRSAIRWTPTSKKPDLAKVSIASMKEILIGKRTEVFRNRDAADCAGECAFSVVYGDDYESLDLLASSPDEANIWVTGLMALMVSLNGSSVHNLNSNHLGYDERDAWLSECFQSVADVFDTDKTLSEDQVAALIADLCPTLPLSKIKQRIKEFQSTKVDEGLTSIDMNAFIEIYKELATRPEIYHLLIRYANKEYMTVDDLTTFLESEQGITNASREYAVDVIERFEPSAASRSNSHLHIEGLTRFLLSDECDIFDPVHRVVCQDMTQPLPHYFIASSHNT